MTKIEKPELLSPAGDLARLKAAIQFKADAVYLGGTVFGMRTSPENFDDEALETAVALAHQNGVKVYLTANVLPRSSELDALPQFLSHAESCGVDAFIISDLGVLEYAKRYAPKVPVHISTQTGIVNYAAANACYRLGARRVVLARELSLGEIKTMRRNIPDDLEIECFVHGAMCVSFSGRCLLSNYLTGRDANRGACAQPCRWKYALTEEKRPGQFFSLEDREDGGTYILNAKDLCMIEHIPQLIDAGVGSFKIEGRAKSEYYVAVITNAYRKAIDAYHEQPEGFVLPQWLREEVTKVSYRDYCTGFYFDDPQENAQISFQGGYNRDWEVVAVVEKWENRIAYCTQRGRFFAGETLEVLSPDAVPFPVTVQTIFNADGEAVAATNHPMMAFSFFCAQEVPAGAFLRIRRSETQEAQS